MKQWKVRFILNGKPMETIVSAKYNSDAKAMIEAQYAGARLQILGITEVR